MENAATNCQRPLGCGISNLPDASVIMCFGTLLRALATPVVIDGTSDSSGIVVDEVNVEKAAEWTFRRYEYNLN
jgi:hypothetical protein